jgi:hypothetical protein
MDQLSRKKNAQAGKRFPMQNNGVVSLVKSIRQNVKLQRSIDKKQVLAESWQTHIVWSDSGFQTHQL